MYIIIEYIYAQAGCMYNAFSLYNSENFHTKPNLSFASDLKQFQVLWSFQYVFFFWIFALLFFFTFILSIIHTISLPRTTFYWGNIFAQNRWPIEVRPKAKRARFTQNRKRTALVGVRRSSEPSQRATKLPSCRAKRGITHTLPGRGAALVLVTHASEFCRWVWGLLAQTGKMGEREE